MAITTLDGYMKARKQRILWAKTTASRTTVGLGNYTMFDTAGRIQETTTMGTLAGTSTTAGVVPTDATAGCPYVDIPTGTGYLTKIEYGNTVVSRLSVYDLLWKGGNYTYNSATTNLSSQPSFATRCPDYPGSGNYWGENCEIWIEVVGAMTSATAWTVQVTYTDCDNSAGTTVVLPTMAATALTVGRMYQLPLQSGQHGVETINSVIVTTGGATAGSFNVLVMRPLVTDMRIRVAQDGGGTYDLLSTGMPIIYDTSALYVVVNADSTSAGYPHLMMEVASE